MMVGAFGMNFVEIILKRENYCDSKVYYIQNKVCHTKQKALLKLRVKILKI